MALMFRADHVGSFLRPQQLKHARLRHARGEIAEQALAEIEDEAILNVVKQQERAGLQSITDGEFRRYAFYYDFLVGLKGTQHLESPSKFVGASPTKSVKVVGKLGFGDHKMLTEFDFLKRHTSRVPKLAIPSPTQLISILRNWRDVVSKDVYADLDELGCDLIRVYQDAIKEFYARGCRYLQLDECNLAMICDPRIREQLAARGDDPKAIVRLYVDIIKNAIAKRPPDMTVGIHFCRGNFRSTWAGEGGYDHVAEAAFPEVNADAYFLEFDDDRSGGFEPLKFIPADKIVVLGLITSKTGKLEDKDEIKRRIGAASKMIEMGRLCISPQCGFASTEEGNELTESDQWRKIEHVCSIAREVWG